jgi:hypothetical protein
MTHLSTIELTPLQSSSSISIDLISPLLTFSSFPLPLAFIEYPSLS